MDEEVGVAIKPQESKSLNEKIFGPIEAQKKFETLTSRMYFEILQNGFAKISEYPNGEKDEESMVVFKTTDGKRFTCTWSIKNGYGTPDDSISMRILELNDKPRTLTYTAPLDESEQKRKRAKVEYWDLSTPNNSLPLAEGRQFMRELLGATVDTEKTNDYMEDTLRKAGGRDFVRQGVHVKIGLARNLRVPSKRINDY